MPSHIVRLHTPKLKLLPVFSATGTNRSVGLSGGLLSVAKRTPAPPTHRQKTPAAARHPAPGRTSFRHHHTGHGNNGPAAAAVLLRPAYATAVAAGVEGAAAERLVSSYAATRSTARMGV
ncbi:unnamed protein product, partial [Ectocarpus sp. 12 AP-2014]